MLSKDELSRYGTATLTSVFLDRVFQECLTYYGEMVRESWQMFPVSTDMQSAYFNCSSNKINLQRERLMTLLFRVMITSFILNICLNHSFFLCSQDYKTYLDFVLALENRKEPAALQYIFKLLDMENQGHLNVFSLNYFFRVSPDP